MIMKNLYEKEPQIKAPRVAPLEGASTSTVAPVDVAHTYGSRHTWRNVSMHCGGHDADERRFVDFNVQQFYTNFINYVSAFICVHLRLIFERQISVTNCAKGWNAI